MSKGVKMVDISHKKDVVRIAKAVGSIKLKRETIERILRGEIEKGDVITVSKIVAISAVKKTPEILPLCHPIPITNVSVNIVLEPDKERILAEVVVKSVGKTGVEMEALVGVSAALLNIWDMVKAYEKDIHGQYPHTKIEEIKVVEKIKGVENEES